MNIIDTLTEGFSQVTKRLWLLIFPILLDLFLWLGPKLSIQPVVDKMIVMLNQTMAMLPADAIPDVGTREMYEVMIEAMQATLGQVNLFALLAWGQWGIPSVAGGIPIDEAAGTVWKLTGYGGMLLAQIAIMGVGLLLAVLFLTLLAQGLRGEHRDGERLTKDILRYWLYAVVLAVPLGLGMVFLISFSSLLGPLAIFSGVLLIWLVLYLSFVPQALTLFDQGPIKAVLTSFTIVRLNFWPSVGFLLLVAVIRRGLGLIWARLLQSAPIGILVAVVGNAFVGTALALAMFLFLHSRVAMLHQANEDGSFKPK